MVSRNLKIPKHGGPDGLGLPRAVFDHLLIMFEDVTISDTEIKGAVELCLSTSGQEQWNNEYREELIKRLSK
jgi:hypothetical protein